MPKALIIDTNVLLVANGDHPDMSEDCVIECIERLRWPLKDRIIVDDTRLIINEYLHKTTVQPPKGPGDVFLKSLLRNVTNTDFVQTVTITPSSTDPEQFEEFPEDALQASVDPADRKFIAAAFAHSDQITIWQAADCKWLDWHSQLQEHDIHVNFVCHADVCEFYRKKFPDKDVPVIAPKT